MAEVGDPRKHAIDTAAGPEERTGDQSDNYVRHRITMTPAAATHPITEGLADFDLDTEQYWVLSDSYNDVLATTTIELGGEWDRPVTCPAVWTRSWGAGRVFVCTVGHGVEDILVPEIATIVRRGLLWAAR